MTRKKFANKRRQRARGRRARESSQARTWGLTRTVGFMVAGIVAIAAMGGAVAFLVNNANELPQAQTGETGSIAPSTSGGSSTSATIGIKVGNRIPDVSMRLTDGSTVSTGSLIGEGKPTFLFFFATW